jgi:hypothetical protein
MLALLAWLASAAPQLIELCPRPTHYYTPASISWWFEEGEVFVYEGRCKERIDGRVYVQDDYENPFLFGVVYLDEPSIVVHIPKYSISLLAGDRVSYAVRLWWEANKRRADDTSV